MTGLEHRDTESAQRVIVGVDGSRGASDAARWAAREALSRGVSLSLVHALDLPKHPAPSPHAREHAVERRREGALLLESAEREIRKEFPGLETDVESTDDSPAHALSALSADAGLLVVGGRGHGGFAGMLLGSVSHRMAAHARCPVVVVRTAPDPDTLDEVVVGVEDERSEAAIRFAFAAAERYGASLHAVGSWYPRAGYYGPLGTFFGDVELIRKEVEQKMRALLDPVRTVHPGVRVDITAGRGNPVPILIETARMTRLLVIGAHLHQGPLSLGTGYIVDGVLAHSPTPVAVVPSVEG